MTKVKSHFRQELEAAVLERHCADHPMTEKWARGELGRNALKGWGIEHYHWTNDFYPTNFYICANAPKDVIAVELENFQDEVAQDRPHTDIVLKFARANGAIDKDFEKGRGLPTTRAWRDWQFQVTRDQHWTAAVAALRIGTESQSPMLYGKVLPALREKYKFREDEIEHFWLHIEADTEHGDAGFELLERYCTTRELKDQAVHFARASARMRWFYFDGIYLHYEMGYPLA